MLHDHRWLARVTGEGEGMDGIDRETIGPALFVDYEALRGLDRRH